MTRPKKPDDIEILIQDFQRSGMRELHLRCDDFELYLSHDPKDGGLDAIYESGDGVSATHAARAASVAIPASKSAAPAITAPLVEQDWPPNSTVVRAPYLGTFYRAPKPGSAPYVELGDSVVPDTDLCLVEVMKLFTAVRAGATGKVHAVLAVDGQLVQGNQPLFVLVPG